MSLVFGQSVDLDSIPAKAFFDTDVEINLEGYEESNSTWSWVIEKPDGSLFTDSSDDNKTIFTFMPTALGFNETGTYTIRVEFDETDRVEISPFTQLEIVKRTNEEEVIRRTFAPFISEITNVEDNIIKISQNWDDFGQLAGFVGERNKPSDTFDNVEISYRINDVTELNTFLHLGDNNKMLVTNIKSDKDLFPETPFANILKLYKPLDEDVQELDNVYIVKEVLPQITEVVDLYPYEQEEEQLNVLIPPESPPKDSPISNRQVPYQNYNNLITTDKKLQKNIIDRFISGSEQVELNVDYSRYGEFVNFSSAQKRLENFKYKLQQIEGFTAQSSSNAALTNGAADALTFENSIRDTKNNFDGYEKYLYNVSSSYSTSSLGETFDASWPKTGVGTYASPHVPITSSNAAFTSWYGSVETKTGQIYSASFYDLDNPNRLINLLPEHITTDRENKPFLDFMDMIGQQFDELWLYTKNLSSIVDRSNKLSEGMSKDLLFAVAKSLGWDTQDGKDLIELSRFGFGQKLSGSGEYELYTSGSTNSPIESDISKEITKRLITSMPYILKTKGTKNSLKAIMNCYGIPSSILRVREYGGVKKDNQKPQFEISRKFTRALGFRGTQFVDTEWKNTSQTTRKPETVQFRFRAASGSDQILVQKDTRWAIKLKDNGKPDNIGSVVFMLSGSEGYKETVTDKLPIYDGDYYSVMLRKQKIDTELFLTGSFEQATALFNPPFITGSSPSAERGTLRIVSSSGVARNGTKSLEFKNTAGDDDPGRNVAYSFLYRSSSLHPSMTAGIANVSEGQTFTLSAFAKVSSSTTDGVGQIAIYELDRHGDVVNWTSEEDYSNVDGGIKGSQKIGLNESEWKQLKVTKRIKFSNTTQIGIQFYNLKQGSTIFYDDVSLRKNNNNSDTLSDAFNYDLFVKKYDAGLDRINLSTKNTLIVSGTSVASQSYNASWTGSGDLFIGGKSSGTGSNVFNAARFTGSMMEFRLWSEVLEEDRFDNHVSNPKSYIGNTPSSSYTNLVLRFSFDDNKSLSEGATIRDISSNQTLAFSGSAIGFGGANTFETLVDRTKTLVPNHGPNRRMSEKIRIEDNFLSGSGVQLSIGERYDFSSNDFAPKDEPRLGIYFSPVDTINEDIVSSFADLDFNQLIGDPRDIFSEDYSRLTRTADEYFKKYTGGNNFFEYMRLIKYYDQNIFKQIRKLIPARAKEILGTLVESNILERPKSPIQRNNPTREQLTYTDTINMSNFDAEHEDSRSVVIPSGDFPNFDGRVRLDLDIFGQPSLYKFAKNDNFDETLRYINASASYGGPNRVFQEATGSVILDNRLSLFNKEFRYFYTSSEDYDKSNIYTNDKLYNLYNSSSRVDSDVDSLFSDYTSFENTFFNGVKNTAETTIDGDSPIVIRTTPPLVAVPADLATSDIRVFDEDESYGATRTDFEQERRREIAQERARRRREQQRREDQRRQDRQSGFIPPTSPDDDELG
tara:strand:- start:1230 stop:5660 length:4431 start_codon:yes stop_codon:yes gene_type:complete